MQDNYVIFNAEETRCVFWSAQVTGHPPSGQQVSCWLPPGTYKVIGKELIQTSSLGIKNDKVTAYRLERKDQVYYVKNLPNQSP